MDARLAAWKDRLRALAARLEIHRDWYLVTVAVVIGLAMSGVAMAFILPLHWIEQRARELPERTLWWAVPTVPMVGALLTGIIHHLIPAGGGVGSGVSRVMFAIHRRKSRISPLVGVRKWLAATCTIGSGGSAGAEGPIVTIGAALGSSVGQLLRTNPPNTAALLGCGAAAGIASVFNAPIAGVFFVMEIMLRDFSLRTFTPIVVASVISAATTQAVLGSDDPLFARGANFAIEAFSTAEIVNYLALGLVCGGATALFIRFLHGTAGVFGRLRIPAVLRPVVGAAILGAMGLAWLAMSPRGVQMPLFYGNGYEVIEELLTPSHYFAAEGQLGSFGSVFAGIVLLGLMKGFATCMTIGSGGAGGMFAPSLMMGATIGGAFGYLVNWIGWFPAASPAHYALVGMAAMVAAAVHAPITGILLVYEITGSYAIILPLMFATVISTIFARVIYRDSVYTLALTAQGIKVGGLSDMTILRRIIVDDVPLASPVFVHPEDSAQRLLDLSERLGLERFVVIDARNRYLGLVVSDDLRHALVFREAIPLLQVSELQRSDLPTVHPQDTLDVVMEKLTTHDADALAVLDEGGKGEVIGLLTRSRLMRTYREALEGDAQ